MVNTNKKINARTGGAVTSPDNRLEFINTGHAAQARYLAALANPFASPAVPIPDSFLTAHVSKIGFEQALTNCSSIRMEFRKDSQEPTGDYLVKILYRQGTVWTQLRQYNSEAGARLVAGGVAFEDTRPADQVGGTVTYRQRNIAFDGTSEESVFDDERMERNRGSGAVIYEVMRRQALDFEGNAFTLLELEFSSPITAIAKIAAIVETDGHAFTETRTSSKDFLVTSSYANHHAGVFADIPAPNYDHSMIPPSHTTVEIDGNGKHHGALAAAAHWVASAAGWTWKHRDAIGRVVRQLPQYYHAAVNYGGSIVSSGGQILSLGARAAPLMLGM